MTVMTGVIVALVPAHNEESQIGTTLTALQSQARAPDRIVVVADNCTDRIAPIAKSIAGVEVFETQGNEHKKAGALNQALALLLPELNEDDLILVQDADSQLDRDFIAAGMKELDARPRLGAVGGTFRASALPEAAPRGARMLLHPAGQRVRPLCERRTQAERTLPGRHGNRGNVPGRDPQCHFERSAGRTVAFG